MSRLATQPGDLSLDSRLERIEQKLDLLHNDMWQLRIKAAMWGSGAAAVIALFDKIIRA